MNADEIRQTMIDVLKELIAKSGRPTTEVGPSTRPMADIDGFDSMEGLLATVEVGSRLSVDIPEDNLFGSDGDEPPTIADVAARLAARLLPAGAHG